MTTVSALALRLAIVACCVAVAVDAAAAAKATTNKQYEPKPTPVVIIPPPVVEPVSNETTTNSTGDAPGIASNTELSVFIDVLGQSGKVRVGYAENGTATNQSITITMDSLYELSASNEIVGRAGKSNDAKHSRQTFANTDFEFSELYNATFPGSDATALAFTFNVTLVGDSTLTVYAYLFNKAGTITNGNDTIEVDVGTMKFSVGVTDWPFCEASGSGDNDCGQGQSEEVGDKLELAIEVKGWDAGNLTQLDDMSYSFGNNSRLVLAKQVDVDGEWQDMESGYPRIESQGSKNTLVLRFPKFAGSVMYDPTIDLGDAPSMTTATAGDDLGGETINNTTVTTNTTDVNNSTNTGDDDDDDDDDDGADDDDDDDNGPTSPSFAVPFLFALVAPVVAALL